MKKNLYSIYDKAVGSYMNPLVCINDAEAIRLFTTFVNEDNPQSNLANYPEQFAMWRIGTMDDESSTLEVDQKELITGNSVVTPKETFQIEDIINMVKEKLK